ncbi:RCK N-terminal domain-containing protein [Haematococcus lacustris]|uniref:RCK N-terminal domain-containing protein n=1 Tax=Haematococcus lacustris TaxID=44745 RepID=A0A699Z4K8_HAELA|nr:RCK N-terminal domain-containing protein [Haematococcus lacustris]
MLCGASVGYVKKLTSQEVEADIRPFRGLLLGLFFVTTGSSVDMGVLRTNWQGGEFAFVLLSLAYSLNVLPENLNQVLIIVVVLSMALTPGLAELGKIHSPVVICGFGPHGQMLAALLDSPMASLKDDAVRNYVAFDLDPIRVQVARAAGFNVVYGDGSRPAVLKAAGIEQPQALAVCLTSNKVAAHRAVASLSQAYPTVPLYAMGADMRDAAELEEAGADKCIISATAAGLAMGGEILARMGASVSELSQAQRTIETAMAERTGMLADQLARYGSSVLEGPDTVLLLGRVPSGPQPASATIVGTALAKLDCDSDEECLPEEVAGLVQGQRRLLLPLPQHLF